MTTQSTESAAQEQSRSDSRAITGTTRHGLSRMRAQLEQRFDELAEMILATDPLSRAPPSGRTRGSDDFPTLQIGFMARAMGLNVSNSQVVYITALVEDDAPSQGVVRCSRLRAVLVDALLTGVLGSGQEAESEQGETPALTRRPPSTTLHCLRDDEQRILRAFQSLDTQRKGYLDPDELRVALMTMGERMTDNEVEEMLLASVDPETGYVCYEDFTDILAHE